MAWTAVFDDGPAANHARRIFAVGTPWAQIVLAPVGRNHREPMSPWASEWVIVGGDGIDFGPPAGEPWPGAAHYWLARVEPDKSPHSEPGDKLAHYRAEQ